MLTFTPSPLFPPLFDVDANLATNVILHMMLSLDDG